MLSCCMHMCAPSHTQEDEARAALEVASMRLAALPDAAELTRRLRDAEAAAADARRRKAQAAALRAEALAAQERKRAEVGELHGRARDALKAARRLERERDAARVAADADRKALEALGRRLAELREEWGQHQGWMEDAQLQRWAQDDGEGAAPSTGEAAQVPDTAGSSGAAAGHGKSDDCSGGEGEVAALSKRLRQLRAQLDCLGPKSTAAAAEHAAARGRAERTASIFALAGRLEGEIAALEADVARGAAGVAAANDAAADEVAGSFRAMAGSLLPVLQVDLVRTGLQAHEGLQIR
jgi:chromosome segregation ATPase